MGTECEKTFLNTMQQLAGKATSDILLKQNEILKGQGHEILQLRAQNQKLLGLLKNIFPVLPSYLGESETPDNPCYRRIVNELLNEKHT